LINAWHPEWFWRVRSILDKSSTGGQRAELNRQPLQNPRDLSGVPMTAARWRRNVARVKRCSNAIQARYPGRL
jgi:hypothetical protein